MFQSHSFISSYLKEHMLILIFTTVLFLTGIIFGAILVNSMGFVQKEDLFFHLNRYFEMMTNGEEVLKIDLLKKSYSFHIKYLFLMFILGLTIIGLPIVWVLIFSKGLGIGFTVGFIVNQLGWNGLLLSSISIAPQNLFLIPIYLIAASIAMAFSHRLLSLLIGQRRYPLGRPFMKYIALFIILNIVAFGGSVVETFIANEGLKSLIKNSYFIISIIKNLI